MDVIHSYGSLDKHKKFSFAHIICARIDVPKLNARMLVDTVVANVVINTVNLVQNMGFTQDLCIYFQQLGWDGRKEGRCANAP